jgi:hypothetical protein
MARIVDKAANIFNGNWDQMLRALSMVFLGVNTYGMHTLQKADELASGGDFPRYFLGEDYFGDAGFKEAFQDGTNQVYHAWGYIAQTATLSGSYDDYESAKYIGFIGNAWHEFVDNGGSGSIQDFRLGFYGMSIGTEITYGQISPYELGDVLRTNLGETASQSGAKP